VAVSLTLVATATAEVATVKPAPALSAAMVTVAGTAATAGLLLERETVAPPGGAAPRR
jgi:hypothetical protein